MSEEPVRSEVVGASQGSTLGEPHLRVAVVSVLPRMLDAVAELGITSRAIAAGRLELHRVDLREHAGNRHRTVDDRPFGGGPGMVLAVDPLRRATVAARALLGGRAWTVYLSPQGRRLDQAVVEELVSRRRLVLVCGRYEGVDERFVELEVDEEISIGDYVLSGGEVAAMAVIEAAARVLPGVLGHADSAREDSFAAGLLDCPHYTRPETVAGRRVPEVLLGGNHRAIRRWRLKQALGRTWLRRPDLLEGRALDAEQRALLDEFIREHRGAGPEPAAAPPARGMGS